MPGEVHAFKEVQAFQLPGQGLLADAPDAFRDALHVPFQVRQAFRSMRPQEAGAEQPVKLAPEISRDALRYGARPAARP